MALIVSSAQIVDDFEGSFWLNNVIVDYRCADEEKSPEAILVPLDSPWLHLSKSANHHA
jgi:hypothetical protein